ncbi:hypothetical protein TCAL_17345 [Tigriopus californicus]|uniref:Uncharacterized protein n=1 Tax=Tigriopus californicus TaxID=6832 RepID=A0A553NZY1_TIGCA|nr:hypothetical protein TCAL_17345 [Tigriopus californicus]
MALAKPLWPREIWMELQQTPSLLLGWLVGWLACFSQLLQRMERGQGSRIYDTDECVFEDQLNMARSLQWPMDMILPSVHQGGRARDQSGKFQDEMGSFRNSALKSRLTSGFIGVGQLRYCFMMSVHMTCHAYGEDDDEDDVVVEDDDD